MAAMAPDTPYPRRRGRRGLPFLVRWRGAVQAGFLLVWLDPLLLRLHGVCGPVFHCYSCPLALFACPIGVAANFAALHLFPFMALGTLIVVGGMVGAFVCGWACPFGFLQDLAGKVKSPRLTLPGWAGLMRYAVLVGLVVLVPYFLGEAHPLFICRVCPAGALEGAGPNMLRQALAGEPVLFPGFAKSAVVVFVLTAMFFVHRPWCTLFCPLGAIYGLFNRASVFFLRFHPGLCTGCGICRKICRQGVEPDRRANDPRCVRCLDCTGCRALSVGSVFGSAVPPEGSASAGAQGGV